MLNEALRLLGLGFNVIPVHARTKRGARVRWRPYQEQRVTEEELRQWFADWTDGLAIVTGQVSGCVVLDMDNKPDANGEQALRSLYDWEPEGPLVRTGGGGLHAYYRHPGGVVGNRAGIEPGVDFRGDGGFVYAPPSPHPSGKSYQWIIPPWECGLPELPAWLHDLVTTDVSPAAKPSLPVPEGVDPDLLGMMDEWEAALHCGVSEGQRNDTCARLAGHYLAMGVGAQAVIFMLLQWNRLNSPPLPDAEVYATVHSIARKEALKRATQAPGRSDRSTPVEGPDEQERDLTLQALSERFGVPLLDIVRVGGSDPYYVFKTHGGEAHVSAGDLDTQTAFRRAMIKSARRIPQKIGSKSKPGWEHFAQLMMNAARDVDPGDEATETGQLRGWLEAYHDGRDLGGQDGCFVEATDPMRKDGDVLISLEDFRRFISSAFGDNIGSRSLAQKVAAMGGESERVRVSLTGDRGETQVRKWRLQEVVTP